MASVLELLLKIKADKVKYHFTMQDGIKVTAIDDFKKTFREKFKIEVDHQFIDFMKLCDGLEENGFVIFLLLIILSTG